MTATIKTSEINALGLNMNQLEAAINAHAQELRWHRDHHADAARDPYPDPVAHPLVDLCIRRPDLVPDFVVVDDTKPTLEQRKSDLVHTLTMEEIAAVQRIWPQRKRRLDSIVYSEAMQKIDGESDLRTADEKKACSDFEDRTLKVAEIEKAAAQAQADIDDLTEETIGAWSNPKFQ